MARDDDLRGKKSFSELDKDRRERKHRRDDDGPGRGRPKESSQAYRAYKSQLDKVFDGGGLPEALKQKLEETGVGAAGKARKEALATLMAADGAAQTSAALTAYREAHGFPEDEGALAKLLELEDEPEVVVEALETIGRLRDEGGLKKGGSLKMRVKAAQMTVDDDDVFAAAKKVLGKL